jgi:hypothetical protein
MLGTKWSRNWSQGSLTFLIAGVICSLRSNYNDCFGCFLVAIIFALWAIISVLQAIYEQKDKKG